MCKIVLNCEKKNQKIGKVVTGTKNRRIFSCVCDDRIYILGIPTSNTFCTVSIRLATSRLRKRESEGGSCELTFFACGILNLIYILLAPKKLDVTKIFDSLSLPGK